MDVAAVYDKLKARLGEKGLSRSTFRDNQRVVVSREQLHTALKFLRDECGFDMLADVTCVDYLHYRGAKDRFGLVYVLVNTVANLRLIVRTYLNEPALTVPSAVPLWESANWLEREVYDMFGIQFSGHPDLRRILMPVEFVDYPLRKDYPLRGRGERHNFERITRNQG